MEYEGQICRPPMERGSYMLPVAVGCSYNQCAFCTLFKHLKYRELPIEQIEEELLRVKNIGGYPKKIFLGDGSPFSMDTERLLAIIAVVHKHFPLCDNVNMDATVTSILSKSDDELTLLRQNGVRQLYIGIECGTDDVLKFMKKDHDTKQAYEAIARVKKAGLVYNAHLMLGIAGKGRGMENAENTARFINNTKPRKIINTSIFLDIRAPLYREIESFRYIPSSELENLIEERNLIQLLTADIESYDGFHDNIEVRTRGSLPRDKEKMLAHLDQAIAAEKANDFLAIS